LFRPVGLPRTEHAWKLEERIEKVIYACRFMTFLGIGGLLAGSIPCFLKGWVYVMDAFVKYYLHGGGTVSVILMLVEAIGNQTDSLDACSKPQMSTLFTV
jgi:phosphatidylserine decarboxylase